MMLVLGRLFKTVQYLSLDVVVGGVVFANSLAYIFKTELPLSISITLGCSIWLIYTLDHLIDGLSAKQTPSMNRHVFHQKYSRKIFLAFVLVSLLALSQLVFLPHTTLIYGCILLGLVGLYFLTIWFFKMFFAKELFIAILYSSGIFLGVISMIEGIPIDIVFFLVQSILLASINLLLFSLNEVDLDILDGHRSWATHFGIQKTKTHLRLLILLMALSLCAGLVQYSSVPVIFSLQLIYSFMCLILLLIHFNYGWFGKNERFRWAGDLIFLFPGLIYLL